MKFGTLHQILNMVTVTWPKIEIFKIQDGGGRHLENRFFGHNSSTGCPISAKFRMRNQNGRSTRATWQKQQFVKIQHGGPPPFWKIVKLPYLSEKSSDCDEIWYTTSDIEPCYSHVTKNNNFWNSRWRQPPSWKSIFGHYSLIDSPISAKFCMRKQNGRSTGATWQKLQIFKIQHGGRPPFWKSLNCHISVKKIVRFWWNLVHCIRYWTRLQSRNQKLQFLKFKMAAAAILEIDFWPLLINR